MAIAARAVILATGALERPFPVRGWTLPGVMTAGGAQVLLEDRGRRAAGAHGARRLRSAPVARRRAIPARRRAHRGAARHHAARPPRAGAAACAGVHGDSVFREGPRARARRAPPRARRRVRGVARAPGRRRGRAPCAFAATAATRRSLPIRCCCIRASCPTPISRAPPVARSTWNELQACFVAGRRCAGAAARCRDSYIAGDGAGIAGAEAAQARGRLTALAVANALGRHRRKRARPRSARSRCAHWHAPCADAASSMSCIVPPTRFAFPRRHARVPLRGSAGGDDRATRARRMRGSQPDEGVHALRHGPVPGALLRAHRDRAHRARDRARAGGRSGTTARAFRSSRSRSRRSRRDADDAGGDCAPSSVRPSLELVDLDVRVLGDLAPLHDFGT